MPWYNKLLAPLAITVAIIATGIAYSQNLGGSSASQSYVDSAIATVIATMPTPVATIPPGPNGAGIAGSGPGYIPGNAAQRQGVQRFNTTTAADGTFTVTWATAFLSASPIASVTPVNAAAATGGLPIICNVITHTSTVFTGKCWLDSSTGVLGLLGIAVLSLPILPPVSTPIMVVGAEPTQ